MMLRGNPLSFYSMLVKCWYSIDQATLSRAHHKNLLSSKEDEQRDQKEQLENDLFEL